MSEKIKIGVALTGSFCTFDKVIPIIKQLVAHEYSVYPIMSDYAYKTDTRFGKAGDFVRQLEIICDKKIIHTILQAEPIGPTKMLDIILVAPCTGNTLAKLTYGIADTSVTMAVKSHLRNQKPVVIAVSTNDALAGASKNIGHLLNYKNIYFIPMKQDNALEKPTSIVADFSKIPQTLDLALQNKQIQPIYL